MKLNFLRISRGRIGLLLRPPSRHLAHMFPVAQSYVQLRRPLPNGTWQWCPQLHEPGYGATPERVAPLCSESDGPYGRVVYARNDRPLPLKLCAKCTELKAKRHAARA
jgi:hypothetical protein